MRHDSLEELTCAGDPHRRNLAPAKPIFKPASGIEQVSGALDVYRKSLRGLCN